VATVRPRAAALSAISRTCSWLSVTGPFWGSGLDL
jgi:hypothetical protein